MSQPLRKITPEEYLAMEDRSEVKYEYYQGQIYMMAGNTANHVAIEVNTLIALGQAAINNSCTVFSSNMRIRVNSNGLYTYPDMSALCGQPQFVPGRTDTITNPSIIVEILSPSTEAYDRGTKFDLYKGLESFTDYLLIAQDEMNVVHHQKQANGSWMAHIYRLPTDVVELPQIGLSLPLSRIYLNVTL